ncbi:MAG TPA: hypothetical protein [Caudoviricetes sp.]|nr:MAG TPA: hypothetical protein [Caudoviricetes sp.]
MIVTCDELDELRKTINHWQADGMYRGPGLGIVALTEDMTAPYIKYLTKDANDLGIMVFSSLTLLWKKLRVSIIIKMCMVSSFIMTIRG